ncbi:transcription factor bHLH144-like [Olea europaea var. sylvestris]|uniref:transcription factor bHLH144-like n=1 Tax=Olea europaea var. sylvestris TaxID=158386 RepID=UPI000C1D805B|nr:transcription factor bHLH144-like [Olea europaea var. sylvestris]XP_022879632.1 transcription factor bHLH144-like [Olea europaea var. sylvestris]XP_022879633.1 transcription factor bHLH144-like [Olea europaea var. sylvestris]
MHSDGKYFPQNPVLPLPNQVGSYYMSKAHIQSIFGGTILPSGIKPSRPFHVVDFLTSDACPRNFVIFDKTKNRSQIMFHPEIGSKYPHPDYGVGMSNCLDNIGWKDKEDREITSFTEDSYDIDALLSTEYENEEYDEDKLSTGRTDANYGSESLDSCSNYESLSRKRRSPPSEKSSEDKKRQKMRKMVKALRGIVPGANQMSTVAVLDEAVRYLKSLRVEVQETGVGNLTKYA